MLKKVLFVINNLVGGGAERSLITLLQKISKSSNYKIDLFLFNKNGIFVKYVPEKVSIISFNNNANLLFDSWKKSIFHPQFLFTKIIIRLTKNKWKYFKDFIPMLDSHYDIAISYLEGLTNFFVIDKVNAKKKYTFIHNILSKQKISINELKIINQFDKIFTVSKEITEDLINLYNIDSNKIDEIRNIIDRDTIQIYSSEFKVNYGKDFVVTTIGRYVDQKNFPLIFSFFSKLQSIYPNLTFNVITNGNETKIKQDITKSNIKKLNTYFNIPNPYPILLRSNLYIQFSRFEGFGIAIAEAVYLGIPILLTNFETAHLHLSTDHQNGIITSYQFSEILQSFHEIYKNYAFYKDNAEHVSKTDFYETDFNKFIIYLN